MIIVEEVCREFGVQRALGPISFCVQKNSIHGFLGPNGAGKSTLFKILGCLLKKTSGSVRICDFDVDTSPNEIKKLLGILPEFPPLLTDMRVTSFLEYVCRLHGKSKGEAKVLTEEVISLLSLKDVSNKLILNLSKGYKQRVGIAQAIVFKPEYILLDEPTAGLDPESVVEVRELIKNLSKDKTILFSSHLLHEVELVSDQITIINKGQKLFSGESQDLLEKFSSLEIAYLSLIKGDV